MSRSAGRQTHTFTDSGGTKYLAVESSNAVAFGMRWTQTSMDRVHEIAVVRGGTTLMHGMSGPGTGWTTGPIAQPERYHDGAAVTTAEQFVEVARRFITGDPIR